MRLTYDPAKNAKNIEERNLPFDRVAEMDWHQAIIVEDTRKDYDERGFRAFGMIVERLFAVVFTPRAGAMHIISFRKANKREVKQYG